LAGVLRAHYPRAVLYGVVAALALANTFNAGADIGAVCAGLRLIFRLPDAVTPWLVFPVAFGILALQFWGSYRLITTTFKWLALALFAFVAAGVLARPDWAAVARATFVPRVDPGNGHYVSTLVAIVGTALSPYLYFWQASQRVEEERCVGRRTLWRRKGATDGELKYAWWDVAAGMFFSCLILYFIVLSTASTLHATGRTTVGTAADAAAALRPAAGAMAEALFAVGFLGAGLLAVPVLTTGAAYAACDAMGWRAGLNYRPGEAPAFYAVIAAATLAGALVNLLPMSPMRTLFVAAVINGLLAAPVLALVVLAGRHPVAMKDRRNGWGLTLMGWVTVAAAALAAGAFLASLV
jgi:Mn2+/Fe2+ NRAMP family transporter